jgi:hypothetical protein
VNGFAEFIESAAMECQSALKVSVISPINWLPGICKVQYWKGGWGIMSQKDFDVLAIIALRKSKFYQKTRDGLIKELPSNIDKQDVRQKLRKAIADLDNNLFIGEEEKKTNTIDPTLPLERLQLNSEEIKKHVLKALDIQL